MLFVVMAVLIFLPYILQNKTLIWEADGLGQYVPKVYRFIQYIPEIFKDIFSGNFDFKQYDFTTGLGATVAISYDPVYWLYLLFSPAKIEKAYSFLIIVRYFLAGLSMSGLVLYFKKSLLQLIRQVSCMPFPAMRFMRERSMGNSLRQ